MPKDPQELKEQIEKANEQPAAPGHSRTAEGKEVPNPERSEFFSNLEKVSGPVMDYSRARLDEIRRLLTEIEAGRAVVASPDLQSLREEAETLEALLVAAEGDSTPLGAS